MQKIKNNGIAEKPLISSMSSREVLRKQNGVVISKPSELKLPQLRRNFAMTIKKTFSAILNTLFFLKQRTGKIFQIAPHSSSI